VSRGGRACIYGLSGPRRRTTDLLIYLSIPISLTGRFFWFCLDYVLLGRWMYGFLYFYFSCVIYMSANYIHMYLRMHILSTFGFFSVSPIKGYWCAGCVSPILLTMRCPALRPTTQNTIVGDTADDKYLGEWHGAFMASVEEESESGGGFLLFSLSFLFVVPFCFFLCHFLSSFYTVRTGLGERQRRAIYLGHNRPPTD